MSRLRVPESPGPCGAARPPFSAPQSGAGQGWRGAIALTFDDGPSPSTPRLLDILAEYRTPATFFQVGTHVRGIRILRAKYSRAGHEIGNHSHSHPLFALKSPAFIEDDFTQAQIAIDDVTGFSPSLMRAPYGVRWAGFRRMQEKLGLTGVMWTVIGLDWRLSAAEIAHRVLARASEWRHRLPARRPGYPQQSRHNSFH